MCQVQKKNEWKRLENATITHVKLNHGTTPRIQTMTKTHKMKNTIIVNQSAFSPSQNHARIQREGGSGGPAKAIEFLSNREPDPWKTIKLPSQHSILGHHRPASETPFKWRFAGGPMMPPPPLVVIRYSLPPSTNKKMFNEINYNTKPRPKTKPQQKMGAWLSAESFSH